MSGDKKTRRRFLADMLFAGGAVTAASVLGYLATHTKPVPEQHPVGAMVPATPPPTPAIAPTPLSELQPDGDVAYPRPEKQKCETRPDALRPAGAPPPPPPQRQGQSARPARRQP